MASEYLMRAKTLDLAKASVGGYFISEKIDGTRAFWDGGVSRGCPTVDVPWANITDPKTGLRKKKIAPFATGLWSRYGNPIIAPDWWLNQLPCCPLDGELWAGRGNFQTCRSIVSRDEPDDRWAGIDFVVFGSPSPANMFCRRKIKNANITMEIDPLTATNFIQSRIDGGLVEDYQALQSEASFMEELLFLRDALPVAGNVYLLNHVQLDPRDTTAVSQVKGFMDSVYKEGGEGVVLRSPRSVWVPATTPLQLKLKPYLDDVATVTGFISGRETDKGSKLLGLIGALILDYNGLRLELSGLTDEERRFPSGMRTNFARSNPGKEMPPGWEGVHFKVGDKVEFRYRELSDDGVPKEARYLRRV